MRFISFLCSIILHILIIFVTLSINNRNPKIDLNKEVTYKVKIITLSTPKEKNKFKIVKKNVKIVKKISKKSISKKKIIKISEKKRKYIKKKIKTVKKIDKERLQQDIIKGALADIISSIKKEEAQKRLIKEEIKSLSKNITSENFSDTYQEENEDIERYKKIAELRIKENWRYPVKEPSLGAKVKIVLSRDGTIIENSFVKSSGNKEFDNSVIKAIKETKLDPLPGGIEKLTFIINFGRESK